MDDKSSTYVRKIDCQFCLNRCGYPKWFEKHQIPRVYQRSLSSLITECQNVQFAFVARYTHTCEITKRKSIQRKRGTMIIYYSPQSTLSISFIACVSKMRWIRGCMRMCVCIFSLLMIFYLQINERFNHIDMYSVYRVSLSFSQVAPNENETKPFSSRISCF